MRCTLIRQSPGRLRFRAGKYAFTPEQGVGLEELLLTLPGVLTVETCHHNGSIFLTHQGVLDPHTVLATLGNLRQLTPVPLSPQAQMKHQEQAFYGDLLQLVLGHGFRKYLLPTLFKPWVAWLRSASYLWAGVKSLYRGKLSVELLDATAIGTSLLTKDYSTASTTMFLLGLSDLLLEHSNMRAKNQLVQSLATTQGSVWRVQGDLEEEIPLEQLAVGDCIRLRKGSQIPVDAEVIGGEGMVNEATMTGEPLPSHKKQGATVFASTVLEEGELDLRVISLSQHSRIAQIVDFIHHGEESKAQIQGNAEQLAEQIVPLSFAMFFGTWLCSGNLARAMSVLVVDFSCAIKLTTPIAVISALKESAEQQLVVKGGKYLEALSQVDCVVFDKTGTLTEAVPKISNIISVHPNYTQAELLTIAACLEEHFPHSVASAIVEEARLQQLSHPEFHGKVEYIVAHGIVSTHNQQRYCIGSKHFILEDEHIPLSPQAEAELDEKIGNDSAVYLAIGEELVGVICIHDPPRPQAKATIEGLRALGISEIIMITGDNENTARHVSQNLGLDGYHASVLPEGKAKAIQALQAQGKKVLMVGDGINDTAALSCADVSMTLAGSSDLAREVADITILSHDLQHILLAHQLSTALMAKISLHYSWIVAFNSSLLLLGMLGLSTASNNALLHNISTLLFALKSSRPLLNQKNNSETTSE